MTLSKEKVQIPFAWPKPSWKGDKKEAFLQRKTLLMLGGSSLNFLWNSIWDSSWPKRRDLWPNFWEGSELPMPNIARRVAMLSYGPKISNLPNKVKTNQMGALLVAIDVLSTKRYFLSKLDRKWLSYGPKCFAQIWGECRSDLSEAHYWNIVNWDVGDFVLSWQFFWPIIHTLVVIELEIDWELYFKPTYHTKLASFQL